MKRKTLLRIALAVALMAGGSVQTRADDYACLVVKSSDSEDVSYQLSDVQKITFGRNTFYTMYFHLTNGEVVEFNGWKTLLFSDDGSAGVSLTAQEPTGLQLQDGTLHVNMVSDGTVILYDAGGKVVRSLHARAGRNSFTLGRLPQGVYVVKVNGISRKFLNK